MSRIFFWGVCALLAAAAPPLRKGVSVQMAVTTSAAAVPDADRADAVVVAVTARGTVYLDVTAVTAAELSGKVKGEKRVYLKADARAAYAAVAEVLDALRSAGVKAPILLTAQNDAADGAYTPPKGLEVLLNAGDAQDARRGGSVVVRMDGKALFGEAVHLADVCHAAGARVYLDAR